MTGRSGSNLIALGEFLRGANSSKFISPRLVALFLGDKNPTQFYRDYDKQL